METTAVSTELRLSVVMSFVEEKNNTNRNNIIFPLATISHKVITARSAARE